MEKGNVLVIGNSGVGKSTLINAVLGDDCEKKAYTARGIKGTTKKLEVYEHSGISFRLIDTLGFEPGMVEEFKAIHAVRKWSKDAVKDGHEDSRINVIWFCVDGTASKLFRKTLDSMINATNIWKRVPIIVVITKSYSEPEREENIKMVKEAFSQHKKCRDRLSEIIPVVALPFTLRDDIFAGPEGIIELINTTNGLLPVGFKAAEQDVLAFNLFRKRALSQSVISVATIAGVTVGGVKLPFADEMILTPTESMEIDSLAKIWGIRKGEESKKLFDTILAQGAVGAAAKLIAGKLKSIPGIQVGAAVINAFIAGSVVFVLGEGTSYIFEQIYMGNKSINDLEWVSDFIKSKFSGNFAEKATKGISDISDTSDKKDLFAAIKNALNEKVNKQEKEN